MLPALAEHDLSAFGEALYEFNRLVGESFRPVQGGTYSHPGSEELVSFIRKQGVAGTGQSSWGPALFAVVGDSAQAEDLARRLEQRFAFGPGEVLVTQAANRGVAVTGLIYRFAKRKIGILIPSERDAKQQQAPLRPPAHVLHAAVSAAPPASAFPPGA